MYQDFYGLTEDPFRLSPDHNFCLRHPSFAKAKAYMQYAAHRAEGFVMITGRPGTGKTTLIEDVLDEIEGKEVITSKLVSAQLEADDLIRMTAFNFGIEAADKAKSALLMEMQGLFTDYINSGKRPLLVIDEAQGLSLSALEELRLLTNLRIKSQPMLQIFLVGQEELRELVLDPGMEQLHQRMIAACHLDPLDFRQTAAYVMHRLKVAGWSGKPKLRAQIFPYVFSFSQGIPRRINLFMSRLMLHGALEGRKGLSEEDSEIILDELKNEHLVPVRYNELFDRTAGAYRADDIDDAVLTPDQKIGGKLMRREKPPSTPPSKQVPDNAAESKEGAPRAQKPESKTENFCGAFHAEEDALPAKRKQRQSVPLPKVEPPPPQPPSKKPLMGFAAGVVLMLLALGIVLLAVPVKPEGDGLSAKLWERSGIETARSRLFEWSGGLLPLFSMPKTPEPAAQPGTNTMETPPPPPPPAQVIVESAPRVLDKEES